VLSSYEASTKFGVEIWSYSQRGNDLDENQFLHIRSVFQSVCNVLMYQLLSNIILLSLKKVLTHLWFPLSHA